MNFLAYRHVEPSAFSPSARYLVKLGIFLPVVSYTALTPVSLVSYVILVVVVVAKVKSLASYNQPPASANVFKQLTTRSLTRPFFCSNLHATADAFIN
jgi:hypothetical protein